MQAGPRTDLTVQGSAIIYRLFDIGYAIDLERVQELLAPSSPDRTKPARVEAQALQIANPPVAVQLRSQDLEIDGSACQATLSARFFDFGVCSLRLEVAPLAPLSWNRFVSLAHALDRSPIVDDVFQSELAIVRQRIATAIERPSMAPVSEDYMLFRITRLSDATALTDERLTPLLLGEPRPLSRTAMSELLANRFSYYEDDLVVLTWENALVLEPSATDRDVEYILEFANAQLLELRVYDAVLDAELPLMYDQVAEARNRKRPLPTRRFQSVLARLQTRVADVTETVERAENALKVTDDVYLARIYAAALEIFRARAWRRGIEGKLEIFRSTYAMLNAEAQSARAELLEIAVLFLFVFEIIVGFLH